MREDEFAGNQRTTEASQSDTAEGILAQEIAALWSAQRDHAVAVRRTREELMTLRRDLGHRLHAMKALLAQTGRAGRWAGYLREQRIPRATADRLVQRHEEVHPPVSEKRLGEALSVEQEIAAFFQTIRPRLLKVLTTQEAAFNFACEMLWLPVVDGDVTDEAVHIYRPAKHGSREAADAASEPLVPIGVE
jgi:hypothetical protein